MRGLEFRVYGGSKVHLHGGGPAGVEELHAVEADLAHHVLLERSEGRFVGGLGSGIRYLMVGASGFKFTVEGEGHRFDDSRFMAWV